MAKPYQGDWVLRSVLFVPGHSDKMLKKGAQSGADCVVLDLEDAVPAGMKAVGREKVREAVLSGAYQNATTFVRVNSPRSGDPIEDLYAVACQEIHGLVYPFVESPDEIVQFSDHLSIVEDRLGLAEGYFSLIAVCESPRGVLNAFLIAKASIRMVALIFGCEDYLAESQGRHSEGEYSLLTPRSMVVMAARAAGIEPIDTPYVKVRDIEGLKGFAQTGRNLGMGGMCAMTPAQIPVIHEIYTPTEEEVKEARAVIAAAENETGQVRGVFISGDKFISPPTVKAARKLIARAEAIRKMEGFSKKTAISKSSGKSLMV